MCRDNTTLLMMFAPDGENLDRTFGVKIVTDHVMYIGRVAKADLKH